MPADQRIHLQSGRRPYTVFYSWQSDTPAKANRNFIEDALKRALKQINADAEVVAADRDPVVLDKDTMGVPGTPPIVETILDKIDQCDVFVPDLTFVAKTDSGRQTPNANVLIEYGWALRSKGHTRMVPVMNEALGAANENSLPFNIRHIRWPIRYTYDGSGSRAAARESFVDQLARAIREVLRNAPPPSEPEFEAVPSTYDEAVFWQPKDTLAVYPGIEEVNKDLSIPVGKPLIFLQLMPTARVDSFLKTQAKKIALKGRLQPFTLQDMKGDSWSDINKHGFIVYRTMHHKRFRHLTQLMPNRELWGVSCELWSE